MDISRSCAAISCGLDMLTAAAPLLLA